MRPCGAPAVRPAQSQLLRPASGDGWIAAGDAAASFDPLSSMGIGHALSSGIEAARVAHAALDRGGATGGADSAAVEQTFARYLSLRDAHYAAERRWSDAPFWAARQGVGPARVVTQAHGEGVDLSPPPSIGLR